MLDGKERDATTLASDWLARFQTALADRSGYAELFVQDAHWRDLIALTGDIRTTSGGAVPGALEAGIAAADARDFTFHPVLAAPCEVERAGETVIEAGIAFRTRDGLGEGVVRLLPDAGLPARAWTISTGLASLHETTRAEAQPAYAKDVRAPNWLDERAAAQAYTDRDPDVLIVGGGHAGLSAAARLGAEGVDTLVIDREKRIGDNWRLRYHNLKLHNQIGVNHLPYMPFPPTWPRYIPKDKIANWLELYAEAMEINFWLETSLIGAVRDDDEQRWTARLQRADGSIREMRPRHIVMAASTSAVKKLPDIPTLGRFNGTKLHSSEFEIGAEWQGRPVMVLGTGTSSHDISQHLHGHGAHVTMVQRSPTMVVNVDPSAQLYDGLYEGDGPSLDERDLINASFPLDLIKRSHKKITDQVKEIDAKTLSGLEAVGFRLEYGENGTGWPMKYRTRGGGYYFNIGCSELIINREIDLIQYHDIDEFVSDGVRMTDGTHRPADLVVMATGYETQGALVRSLFGDAVAEKVGQVWGFNDQQEMASMWAPTGQPGLWFTAGSFAQCRVYSRYLALLIAMSLRA